MPVKLLPKLCLSLNPHMATTHHHLFFTMKLNPTLKTLRTIPIFSQNLNFSRLFSTRIKPNRAAFSSSSKSLIDDEADLSDWVSGLRPNSFNTSLYSSDEDDSNKGRGKRGNVVRDDDGRENRRVGRGERSSLGGGRERFDGEKRSTGFREGGDRNTGFRDSKGYGNENRQVGREKSSSLGGGRERFDGEGKGAGFRDSRGYGNENRQMGREKRSSLGGGRERFDRERKGVGFREGGDRNTGFRDSRGYGNENREMSRESRPGSRGRERFEGERGEDRKMGIRDSKGYGTENRQKGGGGLFRPSSGNSRGVEKFGSGGELKRGEKGLSRGHFMSSDEESGDEGEEVELKKSFSELVSEDSEEDDEHEDDDDDDDDAEEDVDFLNGSGALSLSGKEATPRVAPNSTGSDSYLSDTRFDQCSISPSSLKGIKDAGYEKMTVVQEATLPLILKGKDVLAKAKTGTGKTVAFLLPSIEVVAKLPPAGRDQKRPPIYVLVICPTRELANQAANEANTLLKYHPEIGVQVVIGGTRLALEQKRMQANPCQILVATPGRLKDHIENTAGFATRLMGVKVLVLDEADHLLDMGFRKDIERIIAAVPKQRQTLLFSATVPDEVRQICHIALRRDHEFVDTVGEGTEQTHAQVRQMHLIAPLDKQFSVLYSMLKDHIANDADYKVLVFCTTAMVTRLVANLLAELNLNVREIHSRKPQSYRTRVSDEFRKSKGLILVTSDVSARGVDYPDVSLVIQIGLPSDREQYIHRLGRTGRKGKEGEGILVLAPWEEFFLSSLKDLPITKAPLPLVDPETRKKVERALSHVEMKNKEAAYQAWLGFYNSNKTVARDKCKLVELANEFSRSMGLDNPPAIPKLVLGKMGLKNVPGLRTR